MLKKYAPFILLIAAALFLYYFQNHRRGKNDADRIEITTEGIVTDEGFNRNPEKIIYTKHARCKMACRHIDESEVKEILQNGKLNVSKIETDERGKTYPIEGKTHDDQLIRIVVAPKKNDLVIVTVIDLDTDWPCDCKTF